MISEPNQAPFPCPISKVTKKRTSRNKEIKYYVVWTDPTLEGQWIETSKLADDWEKVQ